MSDRSMMLNVRCTRCGETTQEELTWGELEARLEAIASGEACCGHPQRVMVARSMVTGVLKAAVDPQDEPGDRPRKGLRSNMWGKSEGRHGKAV